MSNSTDTMPAMVSGECKPCQEMATKSGSSNGNGSLAYPTQELPAQTAKSNTTEERPTEEPPSSLAQGSYAAAGWQNDKKVQGQWNNCVDRNGYMYVEGLGWRKFADNSDSAMIAFNIIAAHAKAIGKGVNFYEGDDGKVTTLYVW